MTSEEIAKLCGVSRATVSRVINNDKNVKAKTREKILSIINENKYVPIAPARRLAGIDSNIIGLFIMDIDISNSTTRVSKSTYFSQLVNCIIDQANNAEYQVLVAIITNEKQLKEARDLFMSRTIFSGIFVGAFNDTNHLDEFIEFEYPVIIIDKTITDEEVSPNTMVINLDNQQGGYLATKYFIQQGHRRIGHITGDIRKLSSVQRLNGYEQALRENGLEIDKSLVCYGDFQEESGYQLMINLIKHKVTAVFCANDNMAVGAMKALREQGLKIPNDVALIGFDNISIGNFMTPTLSTIDAPLEHVAKEAIAALIEYHTNKSFRQHELLIPTTLCMRETTN